MNFIFNNLGAMLKQKFSMKPERQPKYYEQEFAYIR